MRTGGDFLVGGSNPGAANTAAALPPAPADWESNRRPKILRPGALPLDQWRMCHNGISHCLEPSERKLLTPPPTTPPPSKK